MVDLYYINNKTYSSEKLNYLVSIKKELDDNNLFSNLLKNYSLFVTGYGKLDKFFLSFSLGDTMLY